MRKPIATVGLYSGFFGLAFAICLFFTFDARVLASMLENIARQNNIQLSYAQAKMSGIAGLELSEAEISSLSRPGSRHFMLHRLTLSPDLFSLPGMLLDLRKKRTPRLAFSFSGWLGGGQRNIGGRLKLLPPGLELDLDLANLPIDQLPTEMIPNFPPLSGKLNAKLRLDIKDLQKPSTWDGTIKADLFQGQLGEFTISKIFKIPGFNLGNANIELELTGGKGPLKSLRLQEGDLLADLAGTVALPEAGPVNFSAVRVQLTGTMSMSDENKQKLPLLAGIIPPKGRLNYSGEIRALSPMIQPAPAPAPSAEPVPNPNPNADDVP